MNCEQATGPARGCRGAYGLVLAAALTVGAVPAAAQTTADAAELRRQIEQMQQQMQHSLETMQQMQRRLEQVEGEAKAASEKVEKATARLVSSGGDRVSLSVSGHVNRGVLFADDGKSRKLFNVDNAASGSRVRFQGRARLDDDIAAGSNFEVQLRTNRSNRANFDDNVQGETSFDVRVIEAYVESQRLGRLAFGQGPTATDGTSDVDHSGTSLVNKTQISDFAGGIQFFDRMTDARSGPQIRAAIDHLNGLGRRNRLRYDTPVFAGFRASGSFSNLGGKDNGYDAALRYGATIGAARVGAAIGYAATKAAGGDILSSSASVLFPMGISLTAVAATRSAEGADDPRFLYGKLGYQFDAFSFGRTALSADYGNGKHFNADGEVLHAIGLGAVQNVDAIGTEFYLGYRYHWLTDSPGADYKPIHALMTGARVRF